MIWVLIELILLLMFFRRVGYYWKMHIFLLSSYLAQPPLSLRACIGRLYLLERARTDLYIVLRRRDEGGVCGRSQIRRQQKPWASCPPPMDSLSDWSFLIIYRSLNTTWVTPYSMLENSILRKYYKIHIVNRGDKFPVLKNYKTDKNCKYIKISYMLNYIFRRDAS